MRKTFFLVHFRAGDPVTVLAFNKSQAKILAQAERIKDGKFYDVVKIEKIED